MDTIMIDLTRENSRRTETFFLPNTSNITSYIFKATRRRGRNSMLDDMNQLSTAIIAGVVTKSIPVPLTSLHLPGLVGLSQSALLDFFNNTSYSLANRPVTNAYDKLRRVATLSPSVVHVPHHRESSRVSRVEQVKAHLETLGEVTRWSVAPEENAWQFIIEKLIEANGLSEFHDLIDHPRPDHLDSQFLDSSYLNLGRTLTDEGRERLMRNGAPVIPRIPRIHLGVVPPRPSTTE